ncbi:MAG: hypothetical protein AAF558_05245, partial [Verrucomicrobiota bacterium]
MSFLEMKKRGTALIITLNAVVLLTVVILAFFSTALLQRKIAFTSTSQIKATFLSRYAIELVLGEIREEIRVGSQVADSTNQFNQYGILAFQPSSIDKFFPEVSSPSLPTSSGTSPIIKQSRQNDPLYQAGRNFGSSVSIGETSRNGRHISVSRWFGRGGPQLGTDSLGQSDLPDWVFVTKGESITTAPNFEATSMDNDYLQGRFAYTVYDISAMMNANVSGYDSSLFSANMTPDFKSSAVFAELSELGFSQSSINEFVQWRNATSNQTIETFSEWATGTPRISGDENSAILAVAHSGYQAVVLGDQAVLSRAELLNHPLLDSSMKRDLTHFSYALNAPSWGPTSNASNGFNYLNDANRMSTDDPLFSNIRFLNTTDPFNSADDVYHYKDDGSTVTYDVVAGEPLLRCRFSLAKLDWLTPKGPSALLPSTDSDYNQGGTVEAIQACFGLIWGAAGDSELSGASIWKYVGHSGTTEQSEIKRLSVVASENREPNFFELLNAAILSGSLGVNGTGEYPNADISSGALSRIHEPDSMLHLLRIGANIIDQSDSDSYPTLIEYQPVSGTYWIAAGVENLPMANMVSTIVGAPPGVSQAVGVETVDATVYCLFGLWNPHRQPSSLDRPPLRLRVRGNITLANFFGDTSILPEANANGWGLPGYNISLDTFIELSDEIGVGANGFVNPTTLSVGDVNASSLASESTSPADFSSTIWSRTHPLGTEQKTGVVACRLPDFRLFLGYSPSSPLGTGTADDFNVVRVTYGRDVLEPFNICMEFQSPSGDWLPYQFFNGINDRLTWITEASSQSPNSLAVTYHDTSRSMRVISYVAPLAPDTFLDAEKGGDFYKQWSAEFPKDTPPGTGLITIRIPWDQGDLLLSGDPRSSRLNTFRLKRDLRDEDHFQLIRRMMGDLRLWTPDTIGGATSPFRSGIGGDQRQPILLNSWPYQRLHNTPTLLGPVVYPALLSRNNDSEHNAHLSSSNSTNSSPFYRNTSYVDRDGQRRIGDCGIYTDISPTMGNPFYRDLDRPLVLNRPFQNVGELGYVFRDLPWRSLDFFT